MRFPKIWYFNVSDANSMFPFMYTIFLNIWSLFLWKRFFSLDFAEVDLLLNPEEKAILEQNKLPNLSIISSVEFPKHWSLVFHGHLQALSRTFPEWCSSETWKKT